MSNTLSIHNSNGKRDNSISSYLAQQKAAYSRVRTNAKYSKYFAYDEIMQPYIFNGKYCYTKQRITISRL